MGADKPLPFQSAKRGVNGAYRYRPTRAGLDFATHGHPVSLISETDQGCKDQNFEFAETVLTDNNDNVELISSHVNRREHSLKKEDYSFR